MTDFGLAKDQAAGRRLTQIGTTMGTPCYMAPEQARSSGPEVGPAADIYALGSILYEMLTGRPPFDAGSPAETMVQVVNDEPLPPSRLRPGLPRDLVTVCLKCLEKAPGKRYASALDLAEDLRRFQAGQTVRARPVGVAGRVYRWCRRRPLVAGLGALSSLLAVAFIATAFDYEIRLQDALAKKVEEEERLIVVQRQQVIQLDLTIGVTELEAGDAFEAVLHFTEALRLDDDPEHERNHRTRIAAALRQCPELTGLVTLDRTILCADVGATRERVVTLGAGGELEVRDARTGRPIVSGLKPQQAPLGGALSPDGRFLGVVHGGGSVRVWDLRTGEAHDLPAGAGGAVHHLLFHPDGQILLTRHADAVTRRWNLTTWEPIPLEGLSGRKVAFSVPSEDGRWLLTLDAGQVGQVWDVATGKTTAARLNVGPSVRLGAVSALGRRLVVVGPDDILSAWDVAASRPLGKPVQLPHGVSHLVFSPDGDRVATAGGDRMTRVWDLRSGELLAEITGLESAPASLHFSPDGRLLLTGSAGGARVWDAATGQALTPSVRHGGSLTKAAFSPGGKQVVTVSQSGTVCFWNLPRGPDVTDDVTGEENQPAARPEGMGDGPLIHLGNGVTIQVNRYPIVHAALSSDGRRLIAASHDRTVRVWDTTTGELLVCGLSPARAVKRVFFRANGARACVLHEGGLISSWDLAPDERPLDTLVALARLQACGRIDEKQEHQALDAERLREVWERLHPER